MNIRHLGTNFEGNIMCSILDIFTLRQVHMIVREYVAFTKNSQDPMRSESLLTGSQPFRVLACPSEFFKLKSLN